MLRTLVAIILSFSIALPGIAMASSAHHSQFKTAHAGHGHHQLEHHESCESGDCGIEVMMMCCALMIGHCSSFGVPADAAGSSMGSICGSAGLSFGAVQLMIGQTFEADPPPPRT